MNWLDAKQAASTLGVDRSTLMSMVARSHPGIEGHPLQVGTKGRNYYRFREDKLEGWASALSAGSPPVPRENALVLTPHPRRARTQRAPGSLRSRLRSAA